MPCNCDHLEPNLHEKESVRVLTFLHEIGLENKKPDLYGNTESIHQDTERLCTACQKIDTSKQSLELQIWWRDHQAADKKKLEDLIKSNKEASEREKAIAKLTPYERDLLGL